MTTNGRTALLTGGITYEDPLGRHVEHAPGHGRSLTRRRSTRAATISAATLQWLIGTAMS